MATVTTSKASLKAEVSYVCSACGAENTQQVTIEAPANSSGMAEARMQKILSELVCDDLSKRYVHANLKCRCSKCRHSEPWAALNFYKLDAWIFASAIICGGMFLTRGLDSIMDFIAHPNLHFLSSVIIGTLIDALPLLIPVGIFAFKKHRAKSSARKIAALPAKSLPTIRILRDNVPTRDDIMARIHEKMNQQ